MRAELHAHHARFAGAQNTHVVVLSSLALSELEGMVQSAFGKMARAREDAPRFADLPYPFDGALRPLLHAWPLFALLRA